MSSLTVDNPFTGDVACTVPFAREADVHVALDRARAAARAFRATKVADRVALCERATVWMEQNVDTIAADITRMMGKPLSQAKGEVAGMAMRARHMMAIAEPSLADVVLPPKAQFERRIVKEPLGVIFDLPAWN